MTNSLSLLRLPNKERLQILRCMDGRSLLLLSLLSQKSKELVRSVGIKFLTSHIMVGDRIFLTIPSLCLSMYFYKVPQDNQRVFVKPKYVWISATEGEDDNKKWHEMKLPNQLEMEEWIEHILYIFNTREIFQLCFDPGFETFDLEILKSVVGNLKYLLLDFRRPRKEMKRILSTFLPDVNDLRLIYNPFTQGDTGLRKILIQNFDSLQLGSWDQFERFTLNDLLVCDASNISLSPNGSFEGINQFLKLWIKGANPRLQSLSIRNGHESNPEEILKGIKICKKYSVEEDILYNNNIRFKGDDPNRTAVDITRFDGVRGTIVLGLTPADGERTLSEIL
ncbi:unnamed protein product [Caenorhabditis brenneri]